MPVNPTRILLADDDPALQRLLRRWLENAGYVLEIADDGQQAMRMIQDDPPQLLITDWQMPAYDGLALCRWLRQQDLSNYVYTIFLTSRTSSEDMIIALEAGADDFMKKPVEKGELLARVRAGTRVLELESRLNFLARTDALTGLLTRRTFLEFMEREWGRAHRHLFPLSCVMIDIDFFKRINDTHGHRAGDQTLRGIARILRQNCRTSDIIGRYGGEEFCVLLPETNEEDAVLWADRVRKLIAASPTLVDDADVPITASFGVAQRLVDTNCPEKLVDLADQALLVAKRSGRDRVVGYQTMSSGETIRVARGSLGAVFQGLTAKDVMATIVAALQQDDTVGSAVRYFLRFRFHSAPVVDKNGKLVGMLSERDVMAIMLWPNWWRTKIKNVMKRNVVWYDDETPVLLIYEFLCRVSIRGVVIVKDGRPMGMISRASLLRWFSNLLAINPTALLEGETVIETQGADGRVLPPEPREKIAMLVESMTQESAALTQRLRESRMELAPLIIGGVSRLEEMLGDILSFLRYATVEAEGRNQPEVARLRDQLVTGERSIAGNPSLADVSSVADC